MYASPNASDKQTLAFQNLTPDAILDAVEAQGYICDGRMLALNSYENRVYQVGMEDGDPLIAKFYRPFRWGDDAIREEHAFSRELHEAELPVVAPLVNSNGETLHFHDLYRFSLYPRRGGRAPELDDPEHLEMIGRFLGQLHTIGQSAAFEHRTVLDIKAIIEDSRQFLLKGDFVPTELRTPYATLLDDLVLRVGEALGEAGEYHPLRIHGDCHPGNILWRDDTLNIVDLDDCCTGPAIHDLWMYLSGDRPYKTARLGDLLFGYTEFREFDPRELRLIEPLRTLRMVYYAAWLARRYQDPAFQQAFPWFGSPRYWDEHILGLREQAAALNEPPLVWD
ncbi:MAG: serine/threonine protein kinase [Pseudomonadota bacterium]